jgi:hypothetical protein
MLLEAPVVVNNKIEECCACDDAKYSLVFKGNWNKINFPKDWPTNGIVHI